MYNKLIRRNLVELLVALGVIIVFIALGLLYVLGRQPSAQVLTPTPTPSPPYIYAGDCLPAPRAGELITGSYTYLLIKSMTDPTPHIDVYPFGAYLPPSFCPKKGYLVVKGDGFVAFVQGQKTIKNASTVSFTAYPDPSPSVTVSATPTPQPSVFPSPISYGGGGTFYLNPDCPTSSYGNIYGICPTLTPIVTATPTPAVTATATPRPSASSSTTTSGTSGSATSGTGSTGSSSTTTQSGSGGSTKSSTSTTTNKNSSSNITQSSSGGSSLGSQVKSLFGDSEQSPLPLPSDLQPGSEVALNGGTDTELEASDSTLGQGSSFVFPWRYLWIGLGIIAVIAFAVYRARTREESF